MSLDVSGVAYWSGLNLDRRGIRGLAARAVYHLILRAYGHRG